MSTEFEKYNEKNLSGIAKDAEAFAILDLYQKSDKDILCILSDGVSLKTCLWHAVVYGAGDWCFDVSGVGYRAIWQGFSPNAVVLSKRIDTLAKLVLEPSGKRRRIVLTSVGAAIQKLPPKKIFLNTRKAINVGGKLNFDDFCIM